MKINNSKTSTALLVSLILVLSLASTVLAAPTANAGSPQTVSVGSTVSFDASASSCSSCSITSYNWNFGDNESATGSNPTHSYSSSGIYTATLVVISNNSEISSDTVAITVQSSDTTDPIINHTAVTEGTNGSSISVTAIVTDNVLVSAVTLYYKNNESSSFSSTSMTASGTTYSGSISSTVVNTSGVNYYISASDSASNSANDPSNAPTGYYNVTVSATDTVPPSTFLVSVAGDTSSVYWDASNDSATSIIVSGESGMSCRYATSDSNYTSMSSSQSCTVSSTQANCTPTSLSQSNYTYYVACKDSSDNEQNASQNLDISFGIDFTAPTTVSTISATAASNSTVTLSWTLPTDSIAGLASQKVYRDASLISTTSATATSYADTNTTDGTSYTYYVLGVDAAGNAQTTGTNASVTADGTAPTITDSGPTSVQTSSSATLTATTNENATCRYGTSNASYSGLSNTFSATGGTVHNQSVAVTTGTLSFYVSCADTAGNQMTTATNVTFEGSITTTTQQGASPPATTVVSSTTTTTATTTTATPTPTPVVAPVTTVSTTNEISSSVDTANSAIATGDLTTATTLLTQAATSATTLVSGETTEAEISSTTSALISATASAAALIEADSTTNAALVLSDISDAAKALATSGETTEASRILAAVSTQAEVLLAADATDAAEAVLDSAVKAGSQVVVSTATTIGEIDAKGLDSASVLGLSDLGLTSESVSAAVATKDEAADLVAQAKRTADPAEKKVLLVKAQELQIKYLEATPEVTKVSSTSDRAVTTTATIDSALSSATTDSAKAALETAKEQASRGALVVDRELNVYQITNKEKTDTTLDRTAIKLSITSPKTLTDVTVVETIPKSVAADASELVFAGTQPTVLQADPIVSWNFESISAGETKDLSYVVKKKVESFGDSVTVASGVVDTVAPTPTPTPTPDATPPAQDNTALYVGIVIVLIVAGYYYFFMMKKGKGAAMLGSATKPVKLNKFFGPKKKKKL